MSEPQLTLTARFTGGVHKALDTLEVMGALPVGMSRTNLTLEPPRDAAHGDLSTNAAMVLAKPAGLKPRELAEALAVELRNSDGVASVEVADPGFLNLRLDPEVWANELALIHSAGDDYGRSHAGAGRTVNVEYVSANPTGPMHMGHCRGAVVGDSLANLLAFTGQRVVREYYVNDAGSQVDTLARSAHLRYREALGEDVGAIPEGLYPGDYLVPVGRALAAEYGDLYAAAPEGEWLTVFRERTVAAMLDLIRADLATLGIHHDVFTSEAALLAAGKPQQAEEALRARDLVYDGELEAPKGQEHEEWQAVTLPLFRSTRFGDDQDRPIRKSDGSWTYFGIDIANHLAKAQAADALIDIWGADHGGTVKRIVGSVDSLTEGRVPLDVKLIQMVRLLRSGEPVKMSKRSGSFVTLAEVVEEVGRDPVRFSMLTRKADAPMDFDFARVVEQSRDNPVFYVQYAHARIASLLRRAAADGRVPDGHSLDKLAAEDRALIRHAAQFPRIVTAAVNAREPHRIAFYLSELAGAFHAFWTLGNERPELRVLREDDPTLTGARLYLAAGLGQVLRNGLALMGVEPAWEM